MRIAPLLLVVACNSSPGYSGPRSQLDEAGALTARTACTFKAGDPVGVSVAKDARLGKQIPIQNIIVLMMENRSFDHLLSNLPAYGQTDVDVADATASNPDSSGQPVAFHHQDGFCTADTDHYWSGSHLEFDDGKNDGFVKTNENFEGGPADGTRAMGFYNETDLPFLYSVANAFAISDRYFCSVLGPTFVNREYLYAATSYGYAYNKLISDHENNLFEVLETKKIDWQVYSETLPGPGVFLETYTHYLDERFSPQSKLFDDLAAGKLAPIVFVDPNLQEGGTDHDDFHPPGDIQLGDALLGKITNAVMASPLWPHTALLISFDENGGLYDHVPPPKACAPDDIAPMMKAGEEAPGGFDQLGFRVPLIVISPYAKPHYVSHKVYDHTSILRFIEARFELGALTARDANADPLFDLFDFTHPALANPPSLASPATPDQAKLDDCIQQYPTGDGGIPGT